MDESKQKTVAFIGQLVNKIFEQLIRGDFNYENDLKRLEKFLDQARQLDEPFLEARILNNIAILNNVSGRSHLCEDYFWQVYEIYEGLNETSELCTTLGNLATVNFTQGEPEKALELYNRGLEISESISSYLISGKMEVLLVLQRYDEAETCFQSIEDQLDDLLELEGQAAYNRRMSVMYRTLAEVHLHRKQFDEAHQHINQAQQLANSLKLTFELAEIYFTCAHIALLQSNNLQAAREYWQQALELVADINSPSHVGHSFLQESRYLHRLGYPDAAAQFAQEAMQIFERHDMHSGITMAQELLG